MSTRPQVEVAIGAHRTQFVPLHPARLFFTSATNAVTTIVSPQFVGSPTVPGAGTSTGQLGAETPPVVWFKRGPGTVVEIRPILLDADAAGGKQAQFAIFTAGEEPAAPGSEFNPQNLYQGRFVCSAVATGGDIIPQVPERYTVPDTGLPSIGYARTVVVANDKSLPPGVKVIGDFGEGPASVVFDAGGDDWIGVAGAALDSTDAATNAAGGIAFAVRSW